MFQKDMAEVVKADISMYADEHQIFLSDCSIDEVAERLQQNTNKMTDWYEGNLLKVNIEKYQLMALGSVKNIDGMDLHIDADRIEQSYNMKLLGENIDSELNFSTRISEVKRDKSTNLSAQKT